MIRINEFKKHILITGRGILTLSFAVFLLQCTQEVVDSEAGNPMVETATALISMPKCLTGEGTRYRSRSEDDADNIYAHILMQNRFVNNLVVGDDLSVKNVLSIFSNELDWEYIRENGIFSHKDDTSYVDAQYSENETYPYSAVFGGTNTTNTFRVSAAYNGDNSCPKGWVYYYVSSLEFELIDSLVILVSFDVTSQQRTLDVKITLDSRIDTGDVAESFNYQLIEKNGIVHVSAGSNHPYIKGILPDTTGHCYVYTAVADTADEKAWVSLGLPPSSYNETDDLFELYGIDKIYGNIIINTEIKALDDTLKRYIVTSYEDSLNIVEIWLKLTLDSTFLLKEASAIDSMTIKNLETYMILNSGLITDSTELKEWLKLMWFLKLTQPVYFNQRGYAGNGTIIPLGFESIAKIVCDRPVLKPRDEIRDLIVVEPK